MFKNDVCLYVHFRGKPNRNFRGKSNRNSNYYYHNYQHRRYQSTNNWNSDVRHSTHAQHAPWLRWVHEPSDCVNKPSDHPRQHSAEPAAKRRAPSGSVPRQPAAENSPQPDSLTNKLTERTSTIINNVLSGKDSADANKRTNAASVQLAAEPTVNASHPGTSGQSKRPAPVPSDRPKNTCWESGKSSDGSRLKGSTPSNHPNMENVPAASKVQPVQGKSQAPWSSPTNRAGMDTQASLVRMATAPRSRREQIELERMLHEHTKKSAVAKDHVHEQPPSADRTGMKPGTNSSQAVSQLNLASDGCLTEGTNSFQFSFNQSECTNGAPANDVIVVGEETGNGNFRSVHERRPSSSNAVQPGNSSTVGADKLVKKACNKKKTKIAKVPKAKCTTAKTGTSKVSKVQAKGAKSKTSKKARKQQNFESGRMQRRKNPLPVRGSANSSAVRPLLSQMPTQLNVDGLLGSLGLLPSLAQGLVGSQNLSSPSASALSSQTAERDPLNTVLQMSLHEENLCNKLNHCCYEIEQLRYARTKLDEELEKRTRLREDVS